DEIVSTSPDRIIVFEGSEQKLSQVTVGILERLGIGNPPWDRGDMGYKTMPVNTTNQLGTGAPATPPPVVAETATAAMQEAWDEDNWEEAQPQPVAEAVPQRQPEMVYAEEDNWGDTPQVQEAAYIEEVPYEEYGAAQPDSPYEDYDVSGDAWADDENPKPYRAQKLNIPEKKKVVEYEEEETDY
ncbi:MAG: photosystem reaction center subunit H, partial [Cyanothece sp. SIO2G6]|nr:photosystem reaction center subunit H [Cyanothece sp. SIO2G6]